MVDTLIAKVRHYLPEDKLQIVTDAYNFAATAHEGQVRMSGEPFIEHPLETAIFLADLRMDANALAAALLHDVIEDCDVDFEEVESKFGTEVAKLVDGVTKLTKTETMADERSPEPRTGSEDSVANAASLR